MLAVMVVAVAGACSGGDKPDDRRTLTEVPVAPDGEWRSAWQGRSADIAWQLWIAPGTHGGLCASIETSVQLGGVSIQRGRDGSSRVGPPAESPMHQGRRANCTPKPNAAEPSEPLYILDIDSPTQIGPGPHYVAAAVASDASDVAAVFSDGSTEPLQPQSGFVVHVWNDQRRLHYIDMRLPDWAGPTRCGSSDGRPIVEDLLGASCYSKDT